MDNGKKQRPAVKAISVRLPLDLAEQLDARAEAERRSQNAMIVVAVAAYLERVK
jgi:predicted transcriptional regulator